MGKFDNKKPDVSDELNIQARYRLIEALSMSERMARLRVENLNEAVFETDGRGCLTFFNQTWTKLLGYDKNESLGRHISDFLCQEDRDQYLGQLISQQGAACANLRAEMRFRHKNGESIWVELSTVPMESGGLIGSLYDIAERKQVENALRKARDELELRVKHRTAELAKINEQLQLEITERKKVEEELTKHVYQQAAVAQLGQHALADIKLSALMEQAVAQCAETLNVEYCKVLELLSDGKALLLRAGVGWKEGIVGHATVGAEKDSQAGYTLLSSEPVIVEDMRTETRFSGPPLLHDHGVVSGMSVIIQGQDQPFGVLGAHTTRQVGFTKDDVNFMQAVANVLAQAIERKQAEEALKQLNEELEQRVEERTQELKDVQEQLVRKEKLAVLGQLAGSVGHEIRNPLGVIGNSVYFLKIKLKGQDEKVLKHLNILQSEVQRSGKLINDLLGFSKASPLSLEEGDLNSIVKETLAGIEIPENITLETRLDINLTEILLDPEQIHQVFQNLISNAIHTMPEGGRLTIKTRANGDFVDIMFSDTGEGVSEENLPKIFEPLFTTKAKGIGLGLAIVKGIIDSHKGRIEVESEIGEGTTFTVKLLTQPIDADNH